jgi:hypothetical protein
LKKLKIDYGIWNIRMAGHGLEFLRI